jgi:hypothetical protein
MLLKEGPLAGAKAFTFQDKDCAESKDYHIGQLMLEIPPGPPGIGEFTQSVFQSFDIFFRYLHGPPHGLSSTAFLPGFMASGSFFLRF